MPGSSLDPAFRAAHLSMMCARFAITVPFPELAAWFALMDTMDAPPRFNIAPTQPILVIAAAPPREPGSNLPERQALLVRWGFIPSWVKDLKAFPLLVNARSETAAEKNAFRAAMRHRRVLVPASGFYEWRREGRGRPQPFWVRPRAGGLVAFAGLMETWSEPGGSEIDTAAILTTAASPDLARIHERMPVVIPEAEFSRWLDCRTQEPRHVADLLAAPPEGFFEAVPVSDRVNKVANMGPDLIEPVVPAVEPLPRTEPPAQGSLF